MLTIYTGNIYSDKLASLDATYAWPEEKRGPYEQFEWFDKHLEEFNTKDVSMKTFSPYLLNYINLVLKERKLNFDKLEVINIYFDKSTDEYYNEDLKILNYNMIDTRCMSEPISWIYEKYNKIIKNK